MKSVCVYCGASPGMTPDYASAARQLAATLVKHELRLVYGGGNVGLLGLLADTVLSKRPFSPSRAMPELPFGS